MCKNICKNSLKVLGVSILVFILSLITPVTFIVACIGFASMFFILVSSVIVSGCTIVELVRRIVKTITTVVKKINKSNNKKQFKKSCAILIAILSITITTIYINFICNSGKNKMTTTVYNDYDIVIDLRDGSQAIVNTHENIYQISDSNEKNTKLGNNYGFIKSYLKQKGVSDEEIAEDLEDLQEFKDGNVTESHH